MNQLIFSAWALLFLSLFSAFSAEGGPDVVVLGTPIDSLRGLTYQHASSIDRKSLDVLTTTDLADGLQSIPGLSIQRSGHLGQLATFRIRGGETGQVLVLRDGLPLNNVISPSGLYSGDFLTNFSLDSVHVIKGPQSLVYGPRALSGVVFLETQKPEFLELKKARGHLGVGAGSYSTYFAKGIIFYESPQKATSVGAHYVQSHGYNITSETDRTHPERDGYQLSEFQAHQYLKLGRGLLSTSLYLQEGKADLDAGFGSERDLDLAHQRKRFYQGGVKWQQDFFGAFRDFYLQASSHHQRDRTTFPAERGIILEDQEYIYKSQSYQIFSKARLPITERTDLALATEWLREEARSTEKFPPFGQTSFPSEHHDHFGVVGILSHHYRLFFIQSGLRLETHSRFSTQVITSLMPGIELPRINSQITLLYSQGKNSPTLYQLFSPEFGNQELLPEKSESWELSWMTQISPIQVGATLFKQETKRLIQLNNDFTEYINGHHLKSEGLEFWLQGNNLKISSTYTRAKYSDSSQTPVDRPRWLHSLQYIKSVNDSFLLGFDLFYKHRRESGSSASPETLPSYARTNVNFLYQISSEQELKLQIQNILDKKYQDIAFYEAPGRTFSLTYQVHF